MIYEFACDNCKVYVEREASITIGPPDKVDCPECNDVMHRVYSVPQVIFKGSGWAGIEAKHGAKYRQAREQIQADEKRQHNRQVAQEEADEISAERNKGRMAAKDFVKHNEKKMKRYKKNRRKGIIKDKKSKTYTVQTKE